MPLQRAYHVLARGHCTTASPSGTQDSPCRATMLSVGPFTQPVQTSHLRGPSQRHTLSHAGIPARSPDTQRVCAQGPSGTGQAAQRCLAHARTHPTRQHPAPLASPPPQPAEAPRLPGSSFMQHLPPCAPVSRYGQVVQPLRAAGAPSSAVRLDVCRCEGQHTRTEAKMS